MKFAEFCAFCEKMHSSPTKEKSSLLKKFVERCRKEAVTDDGTSVFSVFRLLLPDADRARGAYGVKESKLADLYIKVLCLSKASADAQRLTSHRTVKATHTSNRDFADVVYNVMRTRATKPSNLTVQDVNNTLDKLASIVSTKRSEAMADILQSELVSKMSAVEQKWLIRIILKNFRLSGAGRKPLLDAYHPDAQELYDVSNDLEKVCLVLSDPNDRSLGIGISLFTPFSPMLADRATLTKIVSKMGNKPFYVESKLDGERTQIHIEGNKYAYYTRRGFDFSPNYGSDPSSGTFTPRFHSSCRRENTVTCILDGEMVAWNVEGSFIVSKGEHVDVKSLAPTGRLIPCFFAFDILLLNGEIVTNRPFRERLEILDRAVQTKKGVLLFPDRKLVTTKAEVTDLLNEAVDRREEGIVLKDPDSVYKPNARKGGWLKIKPEYVNDMMDHLDLLVIGGYRGQGRRKNLIAMFLLGVAIPSAEPGRPPSEFWSFCRVGSGYSDEQLLGLMQKLQPHWKKWDKKAPPAMIQCGKEKPELWIEPSQSIILEIKASEIVMGEDYKVGLTLRFARVERIRTDRPWHSAMTLNEVKELRNLSSGKLSTRHHPYQEDEPATKRMKADKVTPNLAAPFRPADLSNVSQSSECFAGKELCVLNGEDGMSKQELERLVAGGGGELVQYPGKSTFCVVAAKEDIVVQSLKDPPLYDIVRPGWVLRCLAADYLVSFRPGEMMTMTKATAAEMNQNYDQFGNSLIEYTAIEDVPFILKRVKELVNPEPLSNLEIADLEFQVFSQPLKYSLFRTCVVYVDTWDTVSDPTSPILSFDLEIASLDLRMYGALVTDRYDDNISHVVCHPSSHPDRVSEWRARNRLRYTKFHLVDLSWISASVAKGIMVDEMAHIPV